VATHRLEAQITDAVPTMLDPNAERPLHQQPTQLAKITLGRTTWAYSPGKSNISNTIMVKTNGKTTHWADYADLPLQVSDQNLISDTLNTKNLLAHHYYWYVRRFLTVSDTNKHKSFSIIVP